MNELRFHWPQLQGVGESYFWATKFLVGLIIPTSSQNKGFSVLAGAIYSQWGEILSSTRVLGHRWIPRSEFDLVWVDSVSEVGKVLTGSCFHDGSDLNLKFNQQVWEEQTKSMQNVYEILDECYGPPQIDKFKMCIHFQLQKCLIWQKYSIIKQWKTCYAFC